MHKYIDMPVYSYVRNIHTHVYMYDCIYVYMKMLVLATGAKMELKYRFGFVQRCLKIMQSFLIISFL